MSIHYCSQSGAGTGTGSSPSNAMSAAAFNTYANWSGTPGTAGKISPGDTVYLLGTFTTRLQTQRDGMSGQPVVLRGDYAGTPGFLDGLNTNTCGLRISTNYVSVYGLNFKDFVYPGSYALNGSVNVSAKSHILFDGCAFTNSYDSNSAAQAHIWYNPAGANVSNFVVTGCTFNGPGLSCIVQQTTNNDVDGVWFTDNVVGDGTAQYPVTGQYALGPAAPYDYYLAGGGIVITSNVASGTTGKVFNVTITGNRMRHTRHYGVYVASSIWGFDNNLSPYNVIVTDNDMYEMGRAAIAVTCQNLGTGSLIARNTVNGAGVLKIDKTNAIQICGRGPGMLVIEHNDVQRVYTATTTGDGVGIEIDWAYIPGSDTTAVISDGVIVRYNYCHNIHYNNSEAIGDVRSCGIQFYRAMNCQVYGNVLYDCGTGIDARYLLNTGNVAYNNTIFGCLVGVYLSGELPASTFKNNIIANNSQYGMVAEYTMPGKQAVVLPTEQNNLFWNNAGKNYIDRRTGSEVPVALHSTDVVASPAIALPDFGPRSYVAKTSGADPASFGVGADFHGKPWPSAGPWCVGAVHRAVRGGFGREPFGIEAFKGGFAA